MQNEVELQGSVGRIAGEGAERPKLKGVDTKTRFRMIENNA